MSPTLRSIIGSVLILISTLSLAYILGFYSGGMGWMDFTSNDRYTLTEGTRSILGKIRRPLKAKLFYSKRAIDKIGTDQLKQFNGAYIYARDLLHAYERASDGKLTLEEYDPENFSEAAEEAAALGIRIERLTEDLTFAFGIAITSDTGKKEVIPFVNAREEGLFEYKITKLIERVSRPTKKKLGILSALNVMGDNFSPEMERLMRAQGRQTSPRWNFVQWLAMDYEVEKIEPTASTIPEDVEFLMVVQPKDLQDATLYAIDQYVMRGGKLAIFEDPFCNSDQPQPTPGRQNQYAQFTHPRESQLNRLTSAWGVKMEPGKIIGDRNLAVVQSGVQHFPYVLFTGKKDCFNRNEVVTDSLDENSRVIMVHAGSLTKVDGVEGVDVAPLIQTTEAGGTRKYGNMDMMRTQQDPRGLWLGPNPEGTTDGEKEGFVPGKATLAAAVRIVGKLKSAFPDGLPEAAKSKAENGDGPENKDGKKDEKKDEKKPEHIKECKEPNNVLVFADVDMLSNDFVVSPQSFFGSPMANRAVVLNSLDYLGGSSDLISIRSRGVGRRGFDYINEIRRKAAEKTADKLKSIQDEIDKYQKELQSLQESATGKNVGIARAEALQREREANVNIMKRKRELNEVKRSSTREEEAVKWRAKILNVAGLPALVFLIGLILFIVRTVKRSHQMQEDMA